MREYNQTRTGRKMRSTGRPLGRGQRVERALIYAVITLLIVLLGIFFYSMTARSLQAKRYAETENGYIALEKDMVREVRGYLNRIGLKNSGVMLTRVVEEEGHRQYKLTVHHVEIDGMEESQRELLANQLSQFAFVDSMCDFRYEFIILGD